MNRLWSRMKNISFRNKMIALTFLLLIINLILINYVSFGYVEDLFGEIKTPEESLNSGFRTLLLGIPIFSIIISSIVSIFISKKRSYNKRLIHSFLILLIIFYSIFLVLFVRNLIIW
jgi:hypothetical protein